MRVKIYIYGPLAAMLLAVSLPARGGDLQELPSDREEMGNAFVSAWLQFRKDLDSLAGIDVHPAQYEAWFDQMPEFLLRDAARLGTSHAVILSAISRLAKRGGKQNRGFIADLIRIHKGRSIEPVLRAALIRAGNSSEKNRAIRLMTSAARIHRIEGAILLAAAGKPQGLSYLKSVVKNKEEYADLAALALGRFGRVSDERLLTKALGRPDIDIFIRAALGEIALRKYFPFHYRAFLARNRYVDTHISPNGMYPAWLMISHHAISQGAKTPDQLLSVLKETHRPPSYLHTDVELFKRQMAAFQDFWISVNRRIRTPASPPWPKEFSEAMRRITAAGKKRNPSPEEQGARVAATITVCSALGERLGYSLLAEPTDSLRVISPLGERVLDSNLATSWHVENRQSLILEHAPDRYIKSVMLMLSCPGNRAPQGIVVSGEEKNGRTWRVRKTVAAKARYFQTLPIGHSSAKRVTIGPSGDKNAPLCIAEVRLRFR